MQHVAAHTSARPQYLVPRLEAARDARDWPLLIRLCRQALRKQGRHSLAHRLLGFALRQEGRIDDAVAAYAQAAALWPQDAELLINYADLLLSRARNAEALPLLEKVVALRPDHSVCWTKLAQCCYSLVLHEKGFEASRRGLDVAVTTEQRVNALTQSAIHRRELGQVREAVLDCQEAIALSPETPHLYTNGLLFMLADPQRNIGQLVQLSREFSSILESPLRAQWPGFSHIDRAPWRRLRIGFVSPDFRNHSVMYFVEGLLAQLDRRMFEVVAFYLSLPEDHITQRVKCHVDQFIPMGHLDDETRARKIQEAEIDIAIDLAGHTGGNGLCAMMRKPAPVQISWLGYPATTGLQAIDYKFTDEVTDPADAADQYSEELYRLPTLFCCYRPMIRNPLWRYQPLYLVRPTPALEAGYITFGSCNNLGKLTENVLALWGRILRSVPNSRLLIEAKSVSQPGISQALQERCARAQLPWDRVDLVDQDSRKQYLTYHRIDISLDPFPLVGGTTSFDALWMGTPLISMIGDSFKSRMGVGILSYLGHTEWLAQDEDDYLNIAKELASDFSRINQIRMNLRQEMENSALMREDVHTSQFGEGLRVMWLRWLAQQQHPGDEALQHEAMLQWLRELPPDWRVPPAPEVGIEPGKRVCLQEAHAMLQSMVDKAKAAETPKAGLIEDRRWMKVTEFAEKILCAVPHDPLALACLAEVEHAHGHTDFAMTYLRYATAVMAAHAA